jgi:hypothetical protein
LHAARDETRRQHLAELLPRIGLEQFAATHDRCLAAWLEPTAMQTTRGLVLARAVVEELRKRRIVQTTILSAAKGLKTAVDAARLFNVHPATVSQLLANSGAGTNSSPEPSASA